MYMAQWFMYVRISDYDYDGKRDQFTLAAGR